MPRGQEDKVVQVASAATFTVSSDMQMYLNPCVSSRVIDYDLINKKNPNLSVQSLTAQTAGDFFFFLLQVEFQFKAVDLCVLLTRL